MMNSPLIAGGSLKGRQKYASTAIPQPPARVTACCRRALLIGLGCALLWLPLASSQQPGGHTATPTFARSFTRTEAALPAFATGTQPPKHTHDATAHDNDGPTIHVPIPLDVEVFHLKYRDSDPKEKRQNAGNDRNAEDHPREFALVGSFESESWEGLKINGRGNLIGLNGKRLHHYPGPFVFRVTASLHPPHLNPEAVNESTLDAPARIDDLLFRLRFVVRVNHNLHQWLYPIMQVRNIGAPFDDAYPERTYEIVYQPPVPIPLGDVICLDVFAPDGTHLAKFYLPSF